MYIFLTIAYLLSIIHINGVKSVFFFDETTYNPCKTKLGLYFYPDPANVHSYYQCDEAGNAYLRSCGDLVWDGLRIACNWPTAVIPPSPPSQVNPTVPTTLWPTMKPPGRPTTSSWPSSTSSLPDTTSTSSLPDTTSSVPDTTSSLPDTTSSVPDTTSSLPDTTSSVPDTTSSLPDTTSSVPDTTSSLPDTTSSLPDTTTTTIEPNSTTDNPSFSLCKPVNPCAHGDCVESPITIPSSARRFACICSENWFGRLCDKQIDELTTPATMILDQNKHITGINDTFSLPAKTEKDSKLIFYGLKAGNTIPTFNETEKTIDSQ